MDQRSVRDILAGKTYFIRTFGCQMNQHDSERVSGLLDSYGCLMALDPEHADIVVFMTCCVREAADTRLYGQCNSCKSLPPSPSGKRVVAVGGCIAQRDGEGLLTNVDNVNVIFGTHSIAHVAELIAEAFLDGKRHIRTNEHEDTDAMSMPWHRETQYHAWVPIMTGCNNFCTYCIVPYVRGREMSRPFEEIVDEVTGLVRQGVREITLLGQNVNSYGRDLFGKPRFADLLRAVGDTGVERIFFTSSHPKGGRIARGALRRTVGAAHILVRSRLLIGQRRNDQHFLVVFGRCLGAHDDGVVHIVGRLLHRRDRTERQALGEYAADARGHDDVAHLHVGIDTHVLQAQGTVGLPLQHTLSARILHHGGHARVLITNQTDGGGLGRNLDNLTDDTGRTRHGHVDGKTVGRALVDGDRRGPGITRSADNASRGGLEVVGRLKTDQALESLGGLLSLGELSNL